MKAKFIIVSFLTIFLLSACGETVPVSPTPDINAIYTIAAETVVAEMTQTGIVNTSTPKATTTATQAAEIATSVPTSISVTETPVTILVESSPTSQICDNAIWVADVSVQDGTEMSPGQGFEKIWRIKNTGSCIWDVGYQLVYGYGEEMSGQARNLNSIINPEETVEVTVVFTAPLTTGSYQSYWRMRNSAGANFGEFFYVDIVVR
ncbi:MAG: hypothetical protein ISR59_04275 [Anaerolineales bacterium]|uniref:ApaG domain-containing protein n=1 Tax=Candidatus Desulfolinea nitratireducens TaxID=2841698 RepID=A0A8J6TJK9_9CHLR|nr:hypothetical protein [Candidatus Desulfolinea nitratireducens]MBL6960302.1 hypothetical protein [Anaerolineales bacterium]